MPLLDTDGAVRGVLWADEPHSRLVPSRHVLQALRIFANHAMEALAVATQLEETRFLADHDPLTRLLNRRALLNELGATTVPARKRRSRSSSSTSTTSRRSTTDKGTPPATGCSCCSRHCSPSSSGAATRRSASAATSSRCFSSGAGEKEAREVVGRIMTAVEANIDPLVRTLSASFGIAPSSGGEAPQALLLVADEAMYAAKRSGTRIEVAA